MVFVEQAFRRQGLKTPNILPRKKDAGKRLTRWVRVKNWWERRCTGLLVPPKADQLEDSTSLVDSESTVYDAFASTDIETSAHVSREHPEERTMEQASGSSGFGADGVSASAEIQDFVAENDEQSLLLTQLRRKSEEARQESHDEKPNFEQGGKEPSRRSDESEGIEVSRESELSRLKEERDHSIREVFKVRKGLNSELKQVKEEHATLQAEVEATKLAKKQLEEDVTERDGKVMALEKEVEEAKEEAKIATSLFDEDETKVLDERYTYLKQRLSDETEKSRELEEELKMVIHEKQDVYDKYMRMKTRVLNIQSNLMAQRGRAEKAEAQAAALRRSMKEREVRIDTYSMSDDFSREEKLEMLIEARLKYAEAQKELAIWRSGRNPRKDEESDDDSFENMHLLSSHV